MEAFDGDVLAWQAEGFDVRRSGLELSGVYTAGQFVYDDAWADERAKFERVIASARDMGAGHRLCCKFGLRLKKSEFFLFHAARRSSSMVIASVRAHWPNPKARSIMRTSPLISPVRLKLRD